MKIDSDADMILKKHITTTTTTTTQTHTNHFTSEDLLIYPLGLYFP